MRAPDDPHLRRDIAHSLGIASLACLATCGLLYLAYLGHVLRVAVGSRQRIEGGDWVLVFGKRLQQGRPDADFEARLRHAHRLAHAAPGRPLMLLGGGAAHEPSEAATGLARLRELGLPEALSVRLEDQSQDTLQNLRHARRLLGEAPARVVLLSSRYHLARCARLAGQLGFDFELCAAESRFEPSPRMLGRLAGEAAYLCWLDIGTRWARLIRHRRMLARVT
ncbi:YdcF family protein [Pseudomarimonas salicorniae]|uniref:YdcF family protein n=1 Tax=Pseudomarimonas salicorniae TaxID=2933270 RepID=A0ABT0GCV9_9GAMM|nr:YdcF family protein [Lysobacter sp. CAU 1642]MCK7592374.1 YdcF family protein [Lysobacter sp. CAU 1642]